MPAWLSAAPLIVIILNPVLITLLAVVVATTLLCFFGSQTRRRLLLGAAILFVAYYIADSVFAVPRAVYAYRSASQPEIFKTISTPDSLVLVNQLCDKSCAQALANGKHRHIVFVRVDRSPDGGYRDPPDSAWRLAIAEGSTACASERRILDFFDLSDGREIVKSGRLCFTVEATVMPTDGVFVVRETANFSREPATNFAPRFLTTRPPGPLIRFLAVEVQRRSGTQIEVLAATRYYSAPSVLGLPPMLGCWERPDNVIWIMPPGETGCGLWRWLTEGGDERNAASGRIEWVYSKVFQPPR